MIRFRDKITFKPYDVIGKIETRPCVGPCTIPRHTNHQELNILRAYHGSTGTWCRRICSIVGSRHQRTQSCWFRSGRRSHKSITEWRWAHNELCWAASKVLRLITSHRGWPRRKLRQRSKGKEATGSWNSTSLSFIPCSHVLPPHCPGLFSAAFLIFNRVIGTGSVFP